jgi:hypothetical protein
MFRFARSTVALTFVAGLVTGLPAHPHAAAATEPLPRIVSPVTPVPRPAGFRQLMDSETNRPFVPRGANYVRLSPAATGGYFVSTFEPGHYDPARAEAMLDQLQRNGYNVVRTFIDHGSIPDAKAGSPHGLGRGENDWGAVYGPYMDNVADFVRRAAQHRVHVLPSLDLFPQNAHYYVDLVGPIDPHALNVSGSNLAYLHMGHLRAKQAYLRAFVTELRDRIGARLMPTLLAVQVANEATYYTTERPFSRHSGTFRGPDGITYDMSVPAQRQQAGDAHMVAYANLAVSAVHEVDPQLMVTMGMFSHRIVKKRGPDGFALSCATDCDANDARYWYPARLPILSLYSDLSFLDLHLYPHAMGPDGETWTLDADLASAEWPQARGVVILGEFGALRQAFGDDVNAAAQAMRSLQVDTCARGVSGWLFWTWDTDDDPTQRQFFTASDSSGTINHVLAPAKRPDPCKRYGPIRTNRT